jgi:hypothetical protein
VYSELPNVPDLAASAVEPEEILERRMVRSGNVAAVQVLIKWSGMETTQATWEDYDLLKLRFPSASLWEADETQGEGSVTPDASSVDIESTVQEDHGQTTTETSPPSVSTSSG